MKGLAEKRKKLGLTQIELGKKLNIAGNTIGYYEKGERSPSVKMLKKIAQFFNCTIDELM